MMTDSTTLRWRRLGADRGGRIWLVGIPVALLLSLTISQMVQAAPFENHSYFSEVVNRTDVNLVTGIMAAGIGLILVLKQEFLSRVLGWSGLLHWELSFCNIR